MENDSFIQLFLIVLGIGVALAIPFTLFWLWVSRKGWASVRLFAAWCGMFVLSIGTFLWFQVRETWLIIFTLICALIASTMILTWPITAPHIIKRLHLK